MPPSIGTLNSGSRSLSFKFLVGFGFVVVCCGLFAPGLFRGVAGPSEPVADPPPRSPLFESNPAPPSDSAGLTGTLLKMAGGVVAVAVACVLLTRYRGKRADPAANPNLEVLASLSVDARCAVHLVRVGDRRLLVGVDPAGVKAVAELIGEAAPTVVGPRRVSVTAAPNPADVAAFFFREGGVS